jgi:cytochrome c biogenesis protein
VVLRDLHPAVHLALRSRPPAAPRNLERLPAYTTWRTDAPAEEVTRAAERILKRRRFRAHASGDAVASEKGYLREAGNLLFHISLFGLLIAFAAGHLWNASGGKLIVEGDGFSNTLTQYDDFTPGPLYSADDLDPFSFTLDRFEATYAPSGSQRGTPRTFEAHVTYATGVDGKGKKATIESNHPLEVGGSKVFLIGHGYAPVVTVKDGKGNVAFRSPVSCLPQDANITSTCVIKVQDYQDKDGKPDQLGFQGIFTPTAKISPTRGMYSDFPALQYPAMFLTAYRGDLGTNSGLPQNVYQLNTDKLKQFKGKDGQPLRKALLPGEEMKLPDGAGTLRFDGIREWASFQVSHQPGNEVALASAVVAIAGLAGSLFIQRRRVWVRATRGEDGRTVVEMASLARSESARAAEELADLAVALQKDAPPSGESESGSEDSEDSEEEKERA